VEPGIVRIGGGAEEGLPHVSAAEGVERPFPRTGNLAARPSYGVHEHGQGFDLNTGGFDGDPVYDWLKKSGPRLGFIRTVNREHWHWEYRPEDAAGLAAEGK